MRHSFITKLSAFALVAPAFSASSHISPSQQGTTLRPINIIDYEASMGLQRRDGPNDPSVLAPQNQSQLAYGSLGDDGQLLLANMTLHASDGLPIVSLERFEELTISIDCKDDKGTLDLSFGKKEAFESAKMQWGYVNEEDEGKFLLIANTDGCGTDGQRQAYIVSNITEDEATLTTSLAAQAVPWSDVAGSFDLEFGHAMPVLQSRRLKRDFVEEVENTDNKILNSAKGEAEQFGSDVVNKTDVGVNNVVQTGEDISKVTKGDIDQTISRFSFSIDAGQQGRPFSIYTSEDFALNCINCFISGNLTVMGQVSVHNFRVQNLTLAVSPISVSAALELEAVIDTADDPKTFPFKHQVVPEFAIPGAGISILGIMALGTTLAYNVGGECTIGGSASINFGVNASLPNDAQIVADYSQDGTNSSFSNGFDSSDVTPIFRINNGSLNGMVMAYSQPEIVFGVDLLKVGKVDVSLPIMLPKANLTLSVDYDPNGACGHGAAASKTSIKVDGSAGIEIDLSMDAKLLDVGPAPNYALFSHSWPLFDHCYPVNVPGLHSTLNTTRLPTTPSNTSVPAIASGTAVVPTPMFRVISSGNSAFTTPIVGQRRRWVLDVSTMSVKPIDTTLGFDSRNLTYTSGWKNLSRTSFGFGTIPTATTATPLTSSGAEAASIVQLSTSDDLGTTSPPTLAKSTTISMTETSSTKISTTSASSSETSTPAFTPSFTPPSNGPPSIVSSPTPESYRGTSAVTTSTAPSNAGTSKLLLSPTSSGQKIASPSTSAFHSVQTSTDVSLPTTTSSGMKSTVTSSTRSSEGEPSTTLLSFTSSSTLSTTSSTQETPSSTTLVSSTAETPSTQSLPAPKRSTTSSTRTTSKTEASPTPLSPTVATPSKPATTTKSPSPSPPTTMTSSPHTPPPITEAHTATTTPATTPTPPTATLIPNPKDSTSPSPDPVKSQTATPAGTTKGAGESSGGNNTICKRKHQSDPTDRCST